MADELASEELSEYPVEVEAVVVHELPLYQLINKARSEEEGNAK